MGILRSLGDFRFYWPRLGGASRNGKLYLLLWDTQGQLMPRPGTRGALLVNSRGKRQRGVQERWLRSRSSSSGRRRKERGRKGGGEIGRKERVEEGIWVGWSRKAGKCLPGGHLCFNKFSSESSASHH